MPLTKYEAAGIGGGGTLNYIAKFTPDGFNVGPSQLFDNGSSVGLGTVAPSPGTKLHINRSINDFLYELKVENPNVGISAAASVLIQADVGKMEFGQLSNAFTTLTGYGQTGDTFIRSGENSRNMNFLTHPSNVGKFLFFSRLNPTDDALIPSMCIDGVKVSIGTNSATAYLQVKGITGYNQLRLETNYTPTDSTDANGNLGDIASDDDYIYKKTAAGWKRSALSVF